MRPLALALLLGCATPRAPAAPPAGIAELRLPADAATLGRIATEDEPTRRLDRRRDLLGGLNRQLLMPPPDDALVPELFDCVVALAPRMESGATSAAWGSYLYTEYQRDLVAQRPHGEPRRSTGEVDAVLEGWVAYYAIQATPRGTPAGAASDGFEAMREWRSQQRLGR